MSLPDAFAGRLRLPAIASPMFLVSGPDLVVETCRAGMIGAFPALNQRSSEGFRDWLREIRARLADTPDAAPFAVNLIVHNSNPRLMADLAICAEEKVPLVITSLGAVRDLVDHVHGYGGLVFHDVIKARHGQKAAEAGVDGIIAVAAGAGGHAGTLSPFALVTELRRFFDKTIVLAGAINTGGQVLAAQAMGADMAYLGTRFIATRESLAQPEYKQMIVGAAAGDVVYTDAISGVSANFLRDSIRAVGLDPDNLAKHGDLNMDEEAKAWKTVWSAGHGVAGIDDIPAAADLVARLIAEYQDARKRLAGI
ncbi:NAD(P)H-dependent flavin oxidoreductase [Paracoccus pacificus]|uniref:NAD(P)H-dependent flavin oxidoreductase n=1 Tax=Paracoccus pacificus TaxID=1463598 RepID=A0ABW4R5G9_9RHOB